MSLTVRVSVTHALTHSRTPELVAQLIVDAVGPTVLAAKSVIRLSVCVCGVCDCGVCVVFAVASVGDCVVCLCCGVCVGCVLWDGGECVCEFTNFVALDK